MAREIKYLMLTLLIALISATVFAKPEIESEFTVAEIGIVGNRVIQKETIRFLIQTSSGEILDSRKIRGDIRALFRSGFFEDVQVDAEVMAQGIRLIYRVVEKPILKSYRLSGNRKVSDTTLKEKIELQVPIAYDPVKVKYTVEAIKA
ncbi:hypothetical protein JW979_06755, partial [bacterium]|nr:hypothetical protein [candidate division CSSED10-310 bacterium]